MFKYKYRIAVTNTNTENTQNKKNYIGEIQMQNNCHKYKHKTYSLKLILETKNEKILFLKIQF